MSENGTASPETLAQIADLDLEHRPLIICDVDEVVLNFVGALEQHLDRKGFRLDKVSFALNGNIRHLDDDRPAETKIVRKLIYSFFARETANMEAVPGAVQSLNNLAEYADIVFLTNMPEQYRNERISNLRDHGLNFPVITNSGLKGPAAIEISNLSGQPAFFLDDGPNHVSSVMTAISDIQAIHFVADDHFAELVEWVDGAALHTSNWADAHAFIDNQIKNHPS